MESTITSTAQRIKARNAGFTTIELIVALALSAIVLSAIISYGIFSTRNMRAIGNFVVLDMNSRNALDTMSRDIRQANGCSTNSGQFTSTNLTLLMTDPNSGTNYTISYSYSNSLGTLTRISTAATSGQSSVLLSNCSSFAFSYFQRNPSNGVWDAYPVDSNRPDECKLVQMSWVCGRTVLGSMVNADSIESAKVVIRKE
jgi:prepilin-type N-terminal cleavage/methylation domain-containing protein